MTLLASGPRRAATLAVAAAALTAAACEETRKLGADRAVLATELDKICNAVTLAGAAELPENDRMVQVAMWLDQNIKTEEGLTFPRAFARLGNDRPARYQMLQGTARLHGIRDCPLLAYWK